MTATTACPCGCGQDVPQKCGNVWHNDVPFWEWICINATCAWRDQLYQNQSGDPACSMCGRRRVFVGHFQHGAGRQGRLTMDGKKVSRNTNPASFFWNGRGLLDSPDGDWDALRAEPLGDDPSRGVT